MDKRLELEAENKALRQQLAESEQLRLRYMDLYNQAPVGYLTLDSAGRIIEANHEARCLLGIGDETEVGQRPLHDLILPEELPYYNQQCNLLFRTGQARECHLRLAPPNGPPFWARLEGRVFQETADAQPFAHIILTDIEQHKQAESEREMYAAIAQGILDSANLGLFALDREYRYLIFNQYHADAMKTIYGVDVAIGGTLPEYQTEADWAMAKTNLDRTLAGESIYKENYAGDDILARRYYAIIHSPIRDRTGQIIGVAIVTQDITDQRQAEERQRASERKLSSIFRAAPVGFGLTANRVLLEVNEALCQMFGYQRDELIGQSARILYPDDETFEDAGDVKYRMIAEKGIGAVETRMRRKSGEILDIILSSAALNPDDASAGYTFTVLDISQRKKVEAALQASYQQLEETLTELRTTQAQLIQQERLAAIGQLTGGIAHEFNNIMAVIVLYAQLMTQSTRLAKQDQERISIIEEQAKRAARLTEQILDFSRRSILKRQPLDLHSLLQESLRALRTLLPQRITVKLEASEDIHTVCADALRLQQVLKNLAQNARDAMPEGGLLTIGLRRIIVQPGHSPLLPEMAPGDWIELSVTDEGVGIPPEDVNKVFEPFFTTKGPGGGSGLGLPQVYGIVRQHDGRIGVKTAVGQGTTITIYLPALTEEQHELLAQNRLPQGNQETVLLVEDSDEMREALQESLELFNYRVLAAADIQEALTHLKKEGENIALVIHELSLPWMGTLTLLHALRQRPKYIPLLLLSDYPPESNMKHVFDERRDAWLLKPTSLAKLAQTVADLLAVRG